MLHFCLFGGHGGSMAPGRRLYITLFGACELKRPTLARMIMEARENGKDFDPQRGCFFLTIFGGSGIKAPTMAEEYADMRDLLRSGAITHTDWERHASHLGSPPRIGSFTLFGAFDGDVLPTEEEELDAIAIQQQLGDLSDRIGRDLMLAIGRPSSQRFQAVRRATSNAAVA